MSESTHDLLIRGCAAARVGEAREAKFYLEWMLSLDAELEEKLEAWYWLAKTCTDPVEKRKYLEEVLANQPFHLLARRELMLLDGKLKQADIIDANHIPARPAENSPADLKRFVCPQCGGRMVYSPDGSSLICEYCESRAGKSGNSNRSNENDFLLSMATLQGHQQPDGLQSITCHGCGASFFLPAKTLSLTCPHCKSVYVVDKVSSTTHIAPGLICPVKISTDDLEQILKDWCAEQEIPYSKDFASFSGIYLPVWTFNIGGELGYRYTIVVDKKRRIVEACNGSRPILRSNVHVPATLHYRAELRQIIEDLDSNQLVGYSSDYLADWLAETYQVSVADASLEARQRALIFEKQEAEITLPSNAQDVSWDSHRMMIESFQLTLLPAWIGDYQTAEQKIPIFVDAISGRVFGKDLDRNDEPGFWEKLWGN